MAEAQRTTQGYLELTQRPSCSNCWARKASDHSCSLGDFDTNWAGWCPSWIPVAQWIDKHPNVARQLGLSRTPLADQAQVSA